MLLSYVSIMSEAGGTQSDVENCAAVMCVDWVYCYMRMCSSYQYICMSDGYSLGRWVEEEINEMEIAG